MRNPGGSPAHRCPRFWVRNIQCPFHGPRPPDEQESGQVEEESEDSDVFKTSPSEVRVAPSPQVSAFGTLVPVIAKEARGPHLQRARAEVGEPQFAVPLPPFLQPPLEPPLKTPGLPPGRIIDIPDENMWISDPFNGAVPVAVEKLVEERIVEFVSNFPLAPGFPEVAPLWGLFYASLAGGLTLTAMNTLANFYGARFGVSQETINQWLRGTGPQPPGAGKPPKEVPARRAVPAGSGGRFQMRSSGGGGLGFHFPSNLGREAPTPQPAPTAPTQDQSDEASNKLNGDFGSFFGGRGIIRRPDGHFGDFPVNNNQF